MHGEMLDRKIGRGIALVDRTCSCIKSIACANFAFLHELEDQRELRRFSYFEGSFNETVSEEVDCFFGVEAIANLVSLDGNHLKESSRIFRLKWRETYADYGSSRSAAISFTSGMNYLIIIFPRSDSNVLQIDLGGFWKCFFKLLTAGGTISVAFESRPTIPGGAGRPSYGKANPAISQVWPLLVSVHAVSTGKIHCIILWFPMIK